MALQSCMDQEFDAPGISVRTSQTLATEMVNVLRVLHDDVDASVGEMIDSKTALRVLSFVSHKHGIFAPSFYSFFPAQFGSSFLVPAESVSQH